ncbi:IPTL-CTERM sorting domain-containing protein [Brevundimonas staleyi]|uniref:IPTL-CTERM sorting domain-containing protein n=1 Tax=Brevundimonas staleyi TaxID=74326 RepID=A0ABW0FRU8_9CAUL
MRHKIAALSAFALALAVLPARAAASDLIVNGSFDTDIAGWTAVNTIDCGYAWLDTPEPGLTGGYVAAASGLISDTCGFYQDVTLPAGTTNTLTVTLGTTSNFTSAQDVGRLQIRDTSNVVLETLYTHNGSISRPDPIVSRGPYNLDAYAGQTIRIYFEAAHIIDLYNQRIDNVVLNSSPAPAPVPTLSEWAMILMGLTLAGGAVVMIQRRRMAG